MILATLLFAMPSASTPPPGWRTYLNPRFGYRLCYPGTLRERAEQAMNGDGVVLVDRSGAELRVWGDNNALNDTVESALQRNLDWRAGDDVTYRAKGATWFVLSWRKLGSIVYMRSRYSRDRFTSFQLTYPARDAARWKSLIPKISACLRDAGR